MPSEDVAEAVAEVVAEAQVITTLDAADESVADLLADGEAAEAE